MQATRLSILLLLLPAALAAQMRDGPPTINVNATATVERQPDRAVLNLAVVSEGETAETASQANANLMTRVITALRDLGLSGSAIRTASLFVHPMYANARNDQPRITGYQASNSVQVTIDSIPRVGRITDAAIAAGANQVSGLSFELKDPDAARREALGMAIARARAEAEAVAAAAGRSVGPALLIDVEPIAGGPVFRAMAGRAEMAQPVQTPVEPGTIEISATVRVTYRMDMR